MAKKNSIESAAISFTPGDDGSFSCELRSNLGRFVRVARRESPEVEGDVELTGSPAGQVLGSGVSVFESGVSFMAVV